MPTCFNFPPQWFYSKMIDFQIPPSQKIWEKNIFSHAKDYIFIKMIIAMDHGYVCSTWWLSMWMSTLFYMINVD